MQFASDLYVAAFAAAHEVLGERTNSRFPALVSTALCAEEPGEAFVLALDVFSAADATDPRDAVDSRLIGRAAARIAAQMPFHGSAIEAYNAVPDLGIAWPGAVWRLNEQLFGPDSHTRIEDLFCTPHLYLDDAVGIRPLGLRVEGHDATFIIPPEGVAQMQVELANASELYPPEWRTRLADDPQLLDDYVRVLGVVAGVGRMVSAAVHAGT